MGRVYSMFQSGSDLTIPKNVAVLLSNATARWQLPRTTNLLQTKCSAEHKDAPPMPVTLNGLNAALQKGQLIGVVGPVGAGKSSLLQAILRELPVESGSIQTNGTTSYAGQVPWVFAGTVRQNILFGQAYERERYDAVITACALAADFKQLPHGDRTIIGERGTSLSGGQKARVKWVKRAVNWCFLLTSGGLFQFAAWLERLIGDPMCICWTIHCRLLIVTLAHTFSANALGRRVAWRAWALRGYWSLTKSTSWKKPIGSSCYKM